MDETLFKALEQNGIPPPDNLKYDFFTRWGKNSRYWCVRLDRYNWAFGDFAIGFRGFAFQNTRMDRTPQQMAQAHFKLKQKQEQERQRTQNQHDCRAIIACRNFDSLPPADPLHPYLVRKQVDSHGIRYCPNNNTLKIPLFDIDGKLWNLQSIDASGEKRFMMGAKKKGCFYQIGKIAPSAPIVVSEGFATAASIHQATNLAVFVAFDAGNIEPVANALIRKHLNNKLIIAGDNDWENQINTGRNAAMEVAHKLKIMAIIPNIITPGLSDFNDLHCNFGLTEVRNQFKQGKII